MNPGMHETPKPLPQSRDDALWAAEVAELLTAAPNFSPSVRAAVLQVLRSLADEPRWSPQQRESVLALLDLLETRPAPESQQVADTDDPAAQERSWLDQVRALRLARA